MVARWYLGLPLLLALSVAIVLLVVAAHRTLDLGDAPMYQTVLTFAAFMLLLTAEAALITWILEPCCAHRECEGDEEEEENATPPPPAERVARVVVDVEMG